LKEITAGRDFFSRSHIAGNLFLISIIAAFVWFLGPIIYVASYWEKEEYSHAPFVVVLSFFLAWHNLAEKKPILAPSWSCVVALLSAAFFYTIGRLSAFGSAGGYGFVFVLMAISLAFGGKDVLRALLLPFIFLCFAIPLPQFIFVSLSGDLQLLSSTMGVGLLDAMGVPVFQEGNIIDLGSFKLQVVEACSGLRYLFPLTSFALLIASLMKDRFWKRMVLFVSSAPIAVLMNAVRIALTGIVADQWGVAFARGFVHDLTGGMIFFCCALLLLGEAWLLMRIGHRGYLRREYFVLPQGRLYKSWPHESRPGLVVTAFCVGVAVLVSLLYLPGRPGSEENTSLQHSLRDFPLQFMAWSGREGTLEPDVLAALNLSDYFIGDFARPEDRSPVNFYVGYYANQKTGESSHSPSNCIPGGGWQIVSSEVRTIAVPWAASAGLVVSRILIQKGDHKSLVYYWFDERGRDVTEVYAVKWHLLWDSMLLHRTDGSLIRTVTPIEGPDGESAADARMTDFLAAAMPVLTQFMPLPAAPF